MRREVRHISILGVTLAVMATLASPVRANAATLDELQSQLEQAQSVSDEKQSEYDDAQQRLNEVVADTYKGGSVSVSDILSYAGHATDVMDAIKYGNAITKDMSDKVDDVRTARDEANTAKQQVQALVDQKRRQQESLKNADSIHFAQADKRWGSLPYWNGSVATHGCGLVAYTVAIDILTGRNMTPDQMLAERGDWAGTEQTLDDRTGGHGRTHHDETKQLYDVETESLSLDGDRISTVDNALSGESVVQVCAAGRAFKNNDGYWRYSNGHYIIIYRRDDAGYYYVQDSTWTDKGTAVRYSRQEIGQLLSHAHTLVAYHN